jgi:SagB-type dehydrogenase family enzyme
VSKLLWAAQGLTHGEGLRSAPSAGALYPLFVYLLTGEVESLPTGIYKYRPEPHDLVSLTQGDRRKALSTSALNQEWIEDAAAVIAMTAVYERTTGKYGRRGRRYVHMEVGHAAQNVYLQATALGLGTVLVAAFDDDQVQKVLGIPSKERPLGLMPVGQVNPVRG